MTRGEKNEGGLDFAPILVESGILRVSDPGETERLHALSARITESARSGMEFDAPRLSGEWLDENGWAIVFLSDRSPTAIARLCRILARHGGLELFGMIVDPPMSEQRSIWRIPNGPDDEGVPYANFGVAFSGSFTLVLPPEGGFCILSDEESYVVVLAGPPALLREVTEFTPSNALKRFLDAAQRSEEANGYAPGVLTAEAERYAAHLLRR